MQKHLLEKIPEEIPSELRRLAEGARIYDSSCSPEARVYFIDRGEGLYLKRGSRGTLRREYEMASYFYSIGLGVEAMSHTTEGGYDWLLTRAAVGDDLTSSVYLEDPKRLAACLGENLRALHEVDFSACPIKDRTGEYITLVEQNYITGNYDSSHFPDSFGYRSADEAIAVFRAGKSDMRSEVLLHGDYCLPNVIFKGWDLSAFIDVGNGGVGDRHVDIFWGAWTLNFNLKTDKFRDTFYSAYGKELIDKEKIRLIAAAEVFG